MRITAKLFHGTFTGKKRKKNYPTRTFIGDSGKEYALGKNFGRKKTRL